MKRSVKNGSSRAWTEVKRLKARKRIVTVIVFLISAVVGIIFFFPLYYTFINSIRPLFGLPAVLLPTAFEFENYKLAVTLIPFWSYLLSSLKIMVIGIGIGLVTNFLYGYALARLSVPAAKIFFILVLSYMMVPSISLDIPQYILFSNLGFRGTYWIWFFDALAGNAALIFLCRQYLLGMPKALDEAALIDGASRWTIITRITLPLSKPVLAVVFFRQFIYLWNDYMRPYMYLEKDTYPLIAALFSVDYSLPSNPGVQLVPVKNAAALLLALPVFVVFIFCQKQLVQGVAFSGVKG